MLSEAATFTCGVALSFEGFWMKCMLKESIMAGHGALSFCSRNAGCLHDAGIHLQDTPHL